MITTEQLYAATNRGLDIIRSFYPEAREDGKKFKCREEDDASACLKLYKNVWKLTDFGDDGHALSPLDIAMKETGLSFPKTVALMAERFGVQDESIRESNKAVISSRPAASDEQEGDFHWQEKDFTEAELKVLGPKVTKEICEAYHYKSLAWYSRTKRDENGKLKTTVVSSTDTFPIFMRDCGEFQKIYTPLSYKKEFRFSYAGKKPKSFINGLAELREAVDEYGAQEEPEDEDDPRPPKLSRKYPAAVICCGERDALCCAAYGYKPIWFNSETYALSKEEYNSIASLVETIYYVPDLDYTGRKKAVQLALQFLDIHLVWLPAWLSTYSDSRGKPRKDLRDFAELSPDNASFKKLIENGMPLKFWQLQAETQNGAKSYKYEVNTTRLVHFLRCMGFGIYKSERGDIYVQVTDGKVREVTPGDVRRYISKFVEDQPEAIRNVVYNSARVGTQTFDLIGEVHLDFTRCTPESQNFYFENGLCRVTKDEIKLGKYGNQPVNIWENNITPHKFKRTRPAFRISRREDGHYSFEALDKSSHFFRYLIQTSRMYWREELEEKAEELGEAEKEQYLEANRFEIAGPLLDDAQKDEQVQHLVNKIFAAGYLLHRYKMPNRAWIAYSMDARISENGEANGRSGKSFFMKALGHLLNTVVLSGRNEHLTENPHVLDRVTRHVDLVLVDDAFQYLDLGFFFDNTTGDMVVNPKRLQSYSIPFEESPKIAITTNYAPTKSDGSTQARLLYMAFSDYYHQMNDGSDYCESRDIYSDFGKVLMDSRYPEEEWNADFNFMFDCLQFYLSTIQDNIKIDAPMDKIRIRINKLAMGENFEEWADVYFSETGGKLDSYVCREDMFADFCAATRNNKWTAKKFSKAMRAFCTNRSYILNPPELCSKNGQIIKWIEGKARECFYLQTPGKPLNYDYDIRPDEAPGASNGILPF